MNRAALLMLLLAAPAFCAAMGVKTGRYAWNLGVTGGCMLLLLLTGEYRPLLPMLAALAFSIAGDYFLAHKAGRTTWYVLGIAGFLLAHLCFICYALGRTRFGVPWTVLALALLAGYGFYLARRILPRVSDARMKLALTAYMFASVAALYAALSMRAGPWEKCLFAAGICLILFSDTMIAESDFVHARYAGKIIMPTYYACHILVAASGLVRFLPS